MALAWSKTERSRWQSTDHLLHRSKQERSAPETSRRLSGWEFAITCFIPHTHYLIFGACQNWSGFFLGIDHQFLGSLPLGTLNVAWQCRSASRKVSGCHLLFHRFLTGRDDLRTHLTGLVLIVRKQEKADEGYGGITLGIVLVLAIGSFAIHEGRRQGSNVFLNNKMHRFLLGMFMC